MDKIKIGTRIKKKRIEAGYAQSELAALVGITKAHISDVENGRRFISVETLTLLVKYLHTSYDYILHGK